MLPDICASSFPLPVGDKHYDVSPLTIGDMADILRFVQFQPYSELLKLGNVPSSYLVEVLSECRSKAIKVEDEEFTKVLASIEGAIECAYLSLKHKHPDITREVVGGFDNIDVMRIAELAFAFIAAKADPIDGKKKLLELIDRLKV